MPINKEKLAQLNQLKANPALALMQMMKQHEKEMAEYMKECDKKMEAMMEEKMAKMEQKDPIHANFIQKIVNQAVAQLIKDAKGDQGVQGEKGDRGDRGEKGVVGSQGERGPQGSMGSQGVPGRDGRNGLDGKEGKFPVRGVDYFTPEDKQNFMDKIKESLGIDKLIEKINQLIGLVDGVQRVQRATGKSIHRGGTALNWEAPSGTINGVNKTFTLSGTPYDSGMLLFFVNGQLMKLTDDYTISGSTITTITAPPTGSAVYAQYRQS